MRRSLRGLAWFAFLALLIATGLHFVPLLRQGLQQAARAEAAAAGLRAASAALQDEAAAVVPSLQARIESLRGAGLDALAAREREVLATIEVERASRRPAMQRQIAWLTGQGLAEDLRRDLRIDALEAELAWLQSAAAAWLPDVERRRRVAALRAAERALYSQIQARHAGRCPVGRVRWYELRATPGQIALCREYAVVRSNLAREHALASTLASKIAATVAPAIPDLDRIGAASRLQLDQRLAEVASELERQGLARHVAGIGARLPGAAVWLAATLLLAAGSTAVLRALLYFGLAPWVARRRPVRIASGAGARDTAPVIPTASPSAVSQVVRLQPGEELLVHHRFLQSVATGADMRTRWLLDARFPLTSLAAGLAALTRIRVRHPAEFVVSATGTDALSEIARIDLPEHGALVLQPRCLVGVVQRCDRPLRITRHWRLASLHAWLTLQLRFLVFHGPATLLVAGARGVRVERARGDRAVNQSATLGFSTAVTYSQVRSETFFPYLTGRQALFNDRFDGNDGVFVYEESTGYGRGRGPVARQLEGLADALLRIFGI